MSPRRRRAITGPDGSRNGPLGHPLVAWRQGGLGMVAAFASLVCSLLAVPADSYLGHWGVLGLTLIGGMLAWRLARAVARAAAAA